MRRLSSKKDLNYRVTENTEEEVGMDEVECGSSSVNEFHGFIFNSPVPIRLSRFAISVSSVTLWFIRIIVRSVKANA